MPQVLPADIYPPYPAAFRSDFSLAESVQRLHAAIVPPGFDAETTESAMGSITEGRVRIEHSRPLPRGSAVQRFYFSGSFEQQSGGVVLLGQFIEDLLFRVFPSPFYGLFQPSFRDEVVWLSAVIESALTRPV